MMNHHGNHKTDNRKKNRFEITVIDIIGSQNSCKLLVFVINRSPISSPRFYLSAHLNHFNTHLYLTYIFF